MKSLLIVLLLAVSLLSVSATGRPTPPTWEYKFEYKVNERRANDLADQGWELTVIGNEAGTGTMAAVPFMVFRRAK